ncbi:18465_t:CDS:2, partial [Dentiscutata erythropus]
WRYKTLEFIRVINDNPDTPEEPHEKFKVNKIRYGDDTIQVVMDAIKALVYLDSQSKSVNLAVSGKRITFNELVQQTKNIIIRFITLYPNPWRLIDFRHELMISFIKLKDYILITRILFNKKNGSSDESEKCILQILSTVSNDKENDIRTKLRSIISKYSSKNNKNKKERPLHSWLVPLKKEELGMLPDEDTNTDVTLLTFFLEYYSNNAMENIGWMNVVSEIISELYDRKFGWYAQEFYYKPCFGRKELDLSSMKFHKIEKHSENSLKVYIPITQLIPHQKEFELVKISDDEIPYIRMVPMIDFSTNREFLDPKDKVKQTLSRLFLPGKCSSIKKENYSPFIRILHYMEDTDQFYNNPSMEAVMNWMWYSSKSHWHHTLQIYIVYLFSYSILSWAFIAHLEKKYILDAFNWMDNIAIFLPVILSFYFLFGHYRIDYGFKNAETTQVTVFIVFMSIVFLWCELGHSLFILLGFPSYISLSQAPDSYDVVGTNSNESVYNMVGEIPDNPFSNLLSAIVAVYNWDSIPLDTWDFWPLVVINIIGGFLFVMILSNIIISFMGNAFSNAERDSRHGVLLLQKELIYDYAVLEGSSLTSKTNIFDTLFNDKLRVRYICFLDEEELTKTWNEKSDELGSRWLDAYGFHFKDKDAEDEDDIEEVDFIWTQDKNDEQED